MCEFVINLIVYDLGDGSVGSWNVMSDSVNEEEWDWNRLGLGTLNLENKLGLQLDNRVGGSVRSVIG